MNKLFTNISKLLNSSVRLIEHTELTQNEVGKENIVLWDNRPSLIDNNTYMEFKDAVKKRPSKYYMFNHILSYPDFCISLLCSLEYSLNHKNTVGIPDKTYTAAWRSIKIIADTGTDKVSSWLRPIRQNSNELANTEDIELISNISTADIIALTSDNNKNTISDVTCGATLTPEGQLYNLVTAHCVFNNKLF